MIHPTDGREPNLVTDSRDSTLVEFSDADHPWVVVPKGEADPLLRQIRSPHRPGSPNRPTAPEPPAE